MARDAFRVERVKAGGTPVIAYRERLPSKSVDISDPHTGVACSVKHAKAKAKQARENKMNAEDGRQVQG